MEPKGRMLCKGIPGELGELSPDRAKYLASLRRENWQIWNDLNLIHDLVNGGMDSYMTVWTVVNNLTDVREVKKLTDWAPPGTRFHENPRAVRALVACLERWRKLGVFSSQDSLQRAFDALNARGLENSDLLEQL